MFLFLSPAFASEVPWTYETSTRYDEIEILSGDFYLENGDAVGVFAYNQNSGEFVCGGYSIWSPTSRTVKVYGNDGVTGKDLPGELYLKIWKSRYDCVIDVTHLILSGSASFIGYQTGIPYKSTFRITTPFLNLVNISTALIAVEPQKCNGLGKISLASNTVTGTFSPFSYTLYDIDSEPIATNSKGVYTGLEAGNYILEATDAKGCKQSKEIAVETHFMDISDIKITTKDDVCDNGGMVKVYPESIHNLSTPVWFILENKFTKKGITSTSGDFNNVSDGNYSITIIDDNSCEETEDVSVLSNDLGCNDGSILAPLSTDPNAQKVKIDCSDNIRVIDNSGGVIKTIFGTNIWDGTDSQGALVPNGTYFIYCEDFFLQSIEVLK